ncbi:hypothetical protein SUGI_0353610 [Cryptomeria japonica]|nr:hypothetical protein SUGI_0353610 [Cryptomeria japonica]
MAERLAIDIAKNVAGKIAEIVVSEATLVLNFRDDFEWLQMKLTDISGYLQYADEQSTLNASAKRWLAEVRDIALDAEDIIDECAVEPLYTTPIQSCVCCFSQTNFRRIMGKRIKDLQDRMSSSIQKAQEINLVHHVLQSSQPSTSTSERERKGGAELRRGSKPDSRAVGVEHKVKEIERLLEEPEIGVVAVVGMGGLGKTFLLQHVYGGNKHEYDHSAWVSVSQTCSLRALQGDLAFQIDLKIEASISEVVVSDLIHDKLHGKKCLIVLDDVWKSSVQGDMIQRLGLPTARNKQCKIVVSTRDKDVAAKMRARIYEMQHLSEEDSWNLFCLFAFPDCEGNRPPKQLERLAHQIVEKCGTLPLAVKTVGASMASCSDWQSKLRQLMDVGRADNFTTQILKLSYDSIPSYLKSCFAYLSFFPEDTKIFYSIEKSDEGYIHQEYLIYLLIAEGFIPQEKDREQYDIGLNYLQQLQNLCLLEVQRFFACYTIHDLFLDLVTNISREIKKLSSLSTIRTISFSQNPEITSVPEHLFDRLRVLRVLDFSSTSISTLPKRVGKLKLLKVLNLSQTKIREVPYCVRRLKSLEYLDVSGCSNIQCVPDWIGELKYLSHLDVSACSEELEYMPKGVSKLLSLRTLRSRAFPLSVQDNEFLNVQDVGNLINLQEISFSLKDEAALRSIEDGVLERLVKMRFLRVVNNIPAREDDTEDSNLPAFPEKMNVMKDLRGLWLIRSPFQIGYVVW